MRQAKVIVYPLTNISTPFYRKKQHVVWTPRTPLVVTKVVSSESVIVKPAGKGYYRELEVNTSLLGATGSWEDHYMPLRTEMSIASALKYLKVK